MPNPSVCVVYVHADEPEFLSRSLQIMQSYAWVSSIVVLDTGRSKPVLPENIIHPAEVFGYGFEEQPEHGGFHEVAARNRSLDIALKTGCDWLLLCDADEFFMESMFAEITAADRAGKDVVWLSCYHHTAPNRCIWESGEIRQVFGSGPRLYDPHPRAIRASRRWRYIVNQSYGVGLRNRTKHCHLNHHAGRQVHRADGHLHVHTRHMFYPKRPSDLSKYATRHIADALPDIILSTWRQQNEEGLI